MQIQVFVNFIYANVMISRSSSSQIDIKIDNNVKKQQRISGIENSMTRIPHITFLVVMQGQKSSMEKPTRNESWSLSDHPKH